MTWLTNKELIFNKCENYEEKENVYTENGIKREFRELKLDHIISF